MKLEVTYKSTENEISELPSVNTLLRLFVGSKMMQVEN